MTIEAAAILRALGETTAQSRFSVPRRELVPPALRGVAAGQAWASVGRPASWRTAGGCPLLSTRLCGRRGKVFLDLREQDLVWNALCYFHCRNHQQNHLSDSGPHC